MFHKSSQVQSFKYKKWNLREKRPWADQKKKKPTYKNVHIRFKNRFHYLFYYLCLSSCQVARLEGLIVFLAPLLTSSRNITSLPFAILVQWLRKGRKESKEDGINTVGRKTRDEKREGFAEHSLYIVHTGRDSFVENSIYGTVHKQMEIKRVWSIREGFTELPETNQNEMIYSHCTRSGEGWRTVCQLWGAFTWLPNAGWSRAHSERPPSLYAKVPSACLSAIAQHRGAPQRHDMGRLIQPQLHHCHLTAISQSTLIYMIIIIIPRHSQMQ